MKVLVIGGGASGLTAALTASEDPHSDVHLAERQARVARKLLATGNGRCNLTNRDMDLSHYHGTAPQFCLPALEAFGVEQTLAWFRSMGLLTVTEPGGRVYPASDSANSVADVLRLTLAGRQNVTLHAGCEITELRRAKGGFSVRLGDESCLFDRVIVCAGGAAGGKLGGTDLGYRLLTALGHSRTKLQPSLVQLRTEPTWVRSLKGVRCEVRAVLKTDGGRTERAGELQFTDYGVSGPRDLRAVPRGRAQGQAPAARPAAGRPRRRADAAPAGAAGGPAAACAGGDLLTGMLHNRLGRTVLRRCGLSLEAPCGSLPADRLPEICRTVKAFALPVLGPMGFDAAQVTAGGIRTDEFSAQTLESRLCPGLYAAGEVLDIDGDCGSVGLVLGRLAGQLLPGGNAMLRIRDLILPETHDVSELYYHAAQAQHVRASDIAALHIFRRSLDARKKPDLRWVYTVDVTLRSGEGAVLRRCRSAKITREAPYVYHIPRCTAVSGRVVGFGPAGMFAALVLAKAGLRPLVLERGDPAPLRREKVERFWSGGPLEPESNVQFGEGGAGAFSDGKLNTGTKNERGRWVLQQFVRFGAQEEILYDAKPHVGTDVLFHVIQNLREEVLRLGGEVRFGARLTGLETQDGRITGVRWIEDGAERSFACRDVILAIGHSARDTFRWLHAAGIPMQPKPFAMGVRIEHPQAVIDRAQYGKPRGELPPADYKLAVHLPDGGAAYTFCMCPGGQVVAAASQPGGVVTNGMSYAARGGENANSALLASVTPEDFPEPGPLGGMLWQEQIEQACFRLGGADYHAPAQLLGDFLAHRPSAAEGGIRPTYRPGVRLCDLHDALPKKLTDTLEQAMPRLAGLLPGFDAPDALLTAPETRSSSPVRIVRGEDCQSELRGLYPCGEGAGYAGGILSAAVDGMRCAEAVLSRTEDKT